MLRRAAFTVGIAVVLLVGAPAWAQTEFDPDTVELDEDPVAKPDASEDKPQPEAKPDPKPKPQPKPEIKPQPKPDAEPQPAVITPPEPVARGARRATLRPRARVQRAVVNTSGPTIPAPLQPWVSWALHDSPDLVCPHVGGVRICRWPGTLRIQATSGGASFSFSVFADRETAFTLPGNKDFWPQDVRLDGAAPPVTVVGDVPQVMVPQGAHRIEGTFSWGEVPEVIAVPWDVGNVELTLAGRRVARPRVDAEGRLWLRDGNSESAGETETDSVRASVYRKFQDGVPLMVTTRLRLNVSGRAREVELGQILVAGSRPIAVRAQIPVQITLDGQTKVYVRPGSHDVEIDAVLQKRTDKILAPKPASNFYDPQEVWVWMPNEAVRSVELDGLMAVDPERTSLPSEWSGFTTFLAEPGKGLKLRVTRRGVVETQPNVVNLRRDLWLDLDGEGYTIRDQMTGTLHQDWRLDYTNAAGARLGRVAQHGENLLITEEPETGLSGVELREATLDLEAEIRVETARTNLAIVGWDHDVQSLQAALHLPPGWSVFAADGVDTMPGTWTESWTLWDFFFVLMISIVIGRLFGWTWAGVAILAMCLAHGEPDAPEWIWIHLIATLALLRVLPRGWWRKSVVVYRWGAIIALVIIMAPFIHDQVMTAFHPQVGAGHGSFGSFDQGLLAKSEFARDMAPAAPMQMAAQEAMEEEADGGEWLGDDISPSRSRKGNYGSGAGMGDKRALQLQQVDPNAVVQTGPGLPTWSWSTWNLGWTGPVGRDHEISLYLLSPRLNLMLGVLRIFLLLFLGLLLLAPRDMYWEHRQPVPRWWRTLFGTGLPILLAGVVFAGAQPRAHAAEIPDEVTLAQLRERIAAASTCPEPCVVASDASIAVNALEFEMSADVSAARDTAWTLPGPADVLRIESVQVDGSPTSQLRRSDGLVQVRLPAGNHEVIVVGLLADRNTVTVQFDEGTRPRHVSFDGPGWAIDGISPTGVPDNSLQLTRTADQATPEDTGKSGNTELPPWFEVERRVALGMPWQLHTTVSRVDASRPQLVKLPLVGKEKVITEGIRVEGGFALVDFARGQTAVVFVAEIPIGEKVLLNAALDQPWTETWLVECSRIWRCSFSNLPPVSMVDGESWQPKWKPWPGESLQITVRKPQGAKGDPKTVENVQYDVTPGKRLMQASLSFTIRASQGDWQEITIPDDAQLQSVTIDGAERSIRPQDGVVRLPVQPGEATYALRWQQPWTRGTTERVPAVKIGSPAANVKTTIHLGGERWLLAVRDDEMPWGPAVLFWWSLFLVGLVAVLLGTIPNLPLKWWEWGLLAVGMSQLPVIAMLPIVFWFVLLSWRAREPIDAWWRFDLVQMVAVILTLIAVGSLYAAAHTNLVLDIDMQVAGAQSTNQALRWYADRVVDTLPTPAIVSLPEIVFRVVSFLWALWAVLLIVRSARWGWSSFSNGGWWKFPKSNAPRRPSQPPPPPTAPANFEFEEDLESEEPLAPLVPRHAVDGQIVHVEIQLSRRSSGIGDLVTEQLSEDSGPAEIPPGELDHSALGGLTTDEIIGALVDDSESEAGEDDPRLGETASGWNLDIPPSKEEEEE